MNKTKGLLLAVAVVTMAFTFSCSSDGGDGDEGGGSNSSCGSGDEGGGSNFFYGDGGNQFNPNITYDSFTDRRDGKTYKSVKIGTQTWMAENLNYAIEGSKCYNDNTANCAKYGRLYDWATALGLPSSCNSMTCLNRIKLPPYQGICPSGWHLPLKAEWEVMTDYIGGASIEGKKLKTTSGWDDKDEGTSGNGTDNYGFSALPGGYIHSDGCFVGAGTRGNWWSSSEGEYSGKDAWDRAMGYDVEYARWGSLGKSFFLSVRCLKD